MELEVCLQFEPHPRPREASAPIAGYITIIDFKKSYTRREVTIFDVIKRHNPQPKRPAERDSVLF
jgi:hypothetical protein